MRRTNGDKVMSLYEIHEAIDSVIEDSSSTDTADKIISLEDALQSIETMPRPKTKESIKDLCEALLLAIAAAKDDPQSWKLLILTILHRRFHAKAPEAKERLKNEAEASSSSTSGHGERLSFYIFFMCLDGLARKGKIGNKDFLAKSCECLGRLALPAGGTRDVCALVEHLTFKTLDDAGVLQLQKDVGNKKSICKAVRMFVINTSKNGDGDGDESSATYNEFSPVLQELIKLTATLLDGDLELIESKEKKNKEPQTKKQRLLVSADHKLQSTINTFLPHHDRGTKGRRLVQSIAELMIWSMTSSSKKDVKFLEALENLQNISIGPTNSNNNAGDDDDKIIAHIHSMQTSIRRMRKKLNSSSRAQGFFLRSSFQMDPNSITLSMIKTGKEGDVSGLTALASKARNTHVLRLINHRFTNPSKAIPISTVNQLRNNWVALPRLQENVEIKEEMKNDHEDEILTLKLQVQEATVKATIAHLRSKIPPKNDCKTGNHVLASLDRSAACDGAAILIAAALNPRCVWDEEKEDEGCEISDDADSESSVSLYIGETKYSISTLPDVMNLLDRTFLKGNEEQSAATTKDVQNLIERHVDPGSQLLLFASTDVKLEQLILQKLQEDGSTVHCHIIDEFTSRRNREKAKVGDITVTLAWDNECDLDLHAICPNGDHIYYARKSGGGKIGGGYLDVDMNAGTLSKEPVENIFFGDAERGIEAAHGKYKIFVQNYAYKGQTVKEGDPVPWRVRLMKDGQKNEFTGECVGTGDSSNSTVVEFEYNGRTAPPPEQVGSALVSSNIVAVTSSLGESIDSLSELMQLQKQHNALNAVRNLIYQEEDANNDAIDATAEHEDDANNATAEHEDDANNAADAAECDLVTGATVAPPRSRPLMSDTKSFDVTNRDRLYQSLSNLPNSFILEVNRCFRGGATLLEHTASALAKRLIEDDVHVDELKAAGYKEDLVTLVKKQMATFGV